MSIVSGSVVVAFGLFLFGLAAVIVSAPALAERFLASFASSAKAHYIEQISRLLVGAAMVHFAPSMWFPDLFGLFGWVLFLTALGLLVIPWRWHHRFGKWVIPSAIRHLKLIALGSAAIGAFILYGVSRAVVS